MQKTQKHSERLWDYWTTLPSNAEKATLSLYTDWLTKARPKQLSPREAHHIWLILAGRGWGKTRTGAQDIALYALRNPDTLIDPIRDFKAGTTIKLPSADAVRRVAGG